MFVPFCINFKYFQGFVNQETQETQVLNTRIGLIDTYLWVGFFLIYQFFFLILSLRSSYPWMHSWIFKMFFILIHFPSLLMVVIHYLLGWGKKTFSFFSVLLVILKLKCACSSPLHSPPLFWATPQLNEPLSVSLPEYFLPQQSEQGRVAAWPM